MRAVTSLFLFAAVSIVIAENNPEDIFNKLNSLESKPSVRLDPYIRKALLKALTELEQHEHDDNNTSNDPITDTDVLKTSDETSQTNDNDDIQKKNVRIHSFIVNGQSAFANSTSDKPTFVNNDISIIKSAQGNVANQHNSAESLTKELFETRESNSNLHQVRSAPKSNNLNSISGEDKVKTTLLPSTTTSTTTTTTTPKPTHNEDGENIEEVDKRDVQVFHAPLVAAFTVHQDEQGLPKKVIPIFRQQISGNSSPPGLPTGVLPPQTLNRNPVNELTQPLDTVNPTFISEQIAIQKQLEEKQRILEDQLRQLQFQQRQQEELLRKQQALLQQKDQQIQQQQQQRPLEQNSHNNQQLFTQQLPAVQQTLNSFNNFNQQRSNYQLEQQNIIQSNNQQRNVQFVQPQPTQNNIVPLTTQVTIQPSVPIEPGNLLNTQQQLPNREAIDFLLQLRNQQKEQFPLEENHLPPGISNFLKPGPVLPTNQQNTVFNQFRSVEEPFRPFQRQSNRVFRQENGVGNLGFNQNFNRFNNFNSGQNIRYPVNSRNQLTPNTDLKHLLVQNGLNGRNHEDLNIVTKVLSLNHGIPVYNNLSNRLPFDRRRNFGI